MNTLLSKQPVRFVPIACTVLAALAAHAAAASTEAPTPTSLENVDPRELTVAHLETLGPNPWVHPKVRAALDLGREELAAADRRSDAAWERALPVVQAWEQRGKPYLPWAAKPSDLPQAKIPAFPGAQGGGMFTCGGRGGRVFVVTSLEDSGPGSLREALEQGGPRIVVFNVAGIIHLKERIRIRAPYLTLVGNTAPGNGVCIAGDTVEIETHDVIIRHLRFRRGDPWIGDFNDALGGNAVGNIIIDHVSASWALDENLSLYRHMFQPPEGGPPKKLPTVNLTIQNSIISESLAKNGSTIGGLNSTFHHNLWACNTGRNPSVGMYGDFTFINNVLYNWRDRTVDGGDEQSYFTILNNYYKPGPMTPPGSPIAHRILKPEARRGRPAADIYGRAYVAGNLVEQDSRVSTDNWAGGVQITPATPEADVAHLLATIRADKPWPHAPITVHSARDAYEFVLANAGAALPQRDAVDERVVSMTKSGTATHGVGIVRTVDDVGGYPDYRGSPHTDSDLDGMPDAWEIRYGLNPTDPSDAGKDLNDDGYTNIEDFINGLDPAAPRTDWSDLTNNVDRRDQQVR